MYERTTASERKTQEITRWRYLTIFTGENRHDRRARASFERSRGKKQGQKRVIKTKGGLFHGMRKVLNPLKRILGCV